MGFREKFGGQGLTLLVCLFSVFLLAGDITVIGANPGVTKVWSVPISKYAYSLSVSDTGKVVAVVDINKVSHMQVYSSQGNIERNWSPARGTSFEFCLIRQNYVLATYGDIVSLFGNGGKGQLWAESFHDLWPGAVTMSTDPMRIVVANRPPDSKSTVWMLDKAGNTLWDHQIESGVTCTAITPEGSVIVGGEKYGSFADKGGNAVYLFRPNGSLAWRKETDSPVIDVAASDNCNYIVVGLDSGGMLFLDGNGRVLWKKEEVGAWVDMSGDGRLTVASSLSGFSVLGIDGSTVWQNDTVGYNPGGKDSLNISRNGKTIVGLEAPMVYKGNQVFVFNSVGKKVYGATDSDTSPRIAVSESGKFVAIAFARKLILLRCEW